MKICRFGLWFHHKQDEVIWLFPWHRKHSKGKKFCSLGFKGYFSSLKELDNLWNDYCKACWETDNGIKSEVVHC